MNHHFYQQEFAIAAIQHLCPYLIDFENSNFWVESLSGDTLPEHLIKLDSFIARCGFDPHHELSDSQLREYHSDSLSTSKGLGLLHIELCFNPTTPTGETKRLWNHFEILLPTYEAEGNELNIELAIYHRVKYILERIFDFSRYPEDQIKNFTFINKDSSSYSDREQYCRFW